MVAEHGLANWREVRVTLSGMPSAFQGRCQPGQVEPVGLCAREHGAGEGCAAVMRRLDPTAEAPIAANAESVGIIPQAGLTQRRFGEGVTPAMGQDEIGCRGLRPRKKRCDQRRSGGLRAVLQMRPAPAGVGM